MMNLQQVSSKSFAVFRQSLVDCIEVAFRRTRKRFGSMSGGFIAMCKGGAVQDSLTSVAIDVNKFDVRVDMACVLKLSKSDPLCGAYSSLRAMAFPKGFTALVSTGTYVVNSECGLWPVVMQLPLIVSFKDEGCTDELAISWELGRNGKVYLTTVPLPLEVNKTWKNDAADASIVRLEMVSSLTLVQNHDGNRVARQVNTWLEEHAIRFKNLKLKSLKQIDQWCSKGSFTANFKVVCQTSLLLALQNFKNDAGRKSMTRGTGKEEGRNDEQLKAKSLKDEFEVLSKSIESNAYIYDLDIQERILVAQLPSMVDVAADAPLSDDVLTTIIALCPEANREQMEMLLRKRAVSSLLQSGTASSVHGGTPFKAAEKSTTAAADDTPAAEPEAGTTEPLPSIDEDAAVEINEINSDDEAAFAAAAAQDAPRVTPAHNRKRAVIVSDEDEGEDGVLFRDQVGDVHALPSKRPSKPVNHFDFPEAAAGKTKANKKGRAPGGTKLQYNMSGKYSKSSKGKLPAGSFIEVPAMSCAVPLGNFHTPQSNLFFQQSQSSTHNHSAADVTEVAKLRIDLRDAQHKISMLEQKIELMETSHKVEVSSKEAAIRIEMMDKIESAFQKGYTQCSQAMKEAKDLFNN
jgi:hypothetical protein